MTHKALTRTFPSSSLTHRFFDGDSRWPNWVDSLFSEGPQARSWAPPVEIFEDEAGYSVTAELPGLTKEDIQVTLENNILSITGERKFDEERQAGTARRSERYYGAFARSFTLPRRVDAEKIEARFENGLLHLSIPKAAEARSRTIDIQ